MAIATKCIDSRTQKQISNTATQHYQTFLCDQVRFPKHWILSLQSFYIYVNRKKVANLFLRLKKAAIYLVHIYLKNQYI